MDDDLGKALPHWPAVANPDDVQPVVATQSFSDAQIWRVTVGNRSYALRKWPEMRFDWRRFETHKERIDWRIAEIHTIQNHLASNAPDVVPALERTAEGKTFVIIGAKPNPRRGHCWEVARWMPGESISTHQVTPQRVGSAMRALARVHLGALRPASQERRSEFPWFWKQRDQYARPHGLPLRSLSEAMRARACGVEEIVNSTLTADRLCFGEDPPEREALVEAWEWLRRAAACYHRTVAPWVDVEMPLEPRHGDARVENFLFTGVEVTGLVDYGAADLDSHAADVGRLVGSLVGDDPQRRAAAIDSYQAIRPLSELELAAVDVFDFAGVIVAASRWIIMLIPPPREPDYDPPPPFDLNAGWARLRALVARLRAIVERSAG